MVISKTLFDEISKLSLKEWESIKSTVDYMLKGYISIQVKLRKS